MKLKKLFIAAVAAFAVAGAIAGCGSSQKQAASSAAPKEKTQISVGITPGYSEQIMEFVVKEAEKQGLKVELKTFSDYVTPDQALASGDIDLNSFQHKPYLDAFNAKNGTDLVSIGNTYLAPLRVYSSKIKNLSELKDGDSISVPNDPSNEGRALLLLSKQGVIKLKDGTDPTKATPQDIAENPKNIKFVELEAAQLPRSLADVAVSVINSGYAKSAGLDSKTALATEDDTSPYVNIIAARAKDKDDPAYQKFVKIFQSPAVKDYINEYAKGDLVPAF